MKNNNNKKGMSPGTQDQIRKISPIQRRYSTSTEANKKVNQVNGDPTPWLFSLLRSRSELGPCRLYRKGVVKISKFPFLLQFQDKSLQRFKISSDTWGKWRWKVEQRILLYQVYNIQPGSAVRKILDS